MGAALRAGCGLSGDGHEGWVRKVYNPAEVFWLGAACGAAIVLFALLALWMRRKDAALTPYQQSRQDNFFGKVMVWAALSAVGWTIVAVVGALNSTFALPHLEWVVGVLVGVGVPLGLRWLWRHRGVERAGQ